MAACVAVAVVVSEGGSGEAGRALFVIPAIAAGTAMDAVFGTWRGRRRDIWMQRQVEEDRERAYRSNTGRLREAGLRHAIMREEVGRYRVPPAALVPVAWVSSHGVTGPGRSEPGVEASGEPRSATGGAPRSATGGEPRSATGGAPRSATGGATGVGDGVPLLAPIAADFTVDGHPLLVRSTVRHLVLSLLAAIPRATLRVTCGGWCAWSQLRSDGAPVGLLADQDESETPHCTCGEWIGVPYLGAGSSGHPEGPDTSAMRARASATRQRPGGSDEKHAHGGAPLSRRAGPYAYVVGEDTAQVEGMAEEKDEGQSRAMAPDLTRERTTSFAASVQRPLVAKAKPVVPPRELTVLNIRFRHATRGPPHRGEPPRWQVVVCLCESNETREGSETEAGRETRQGRETGEEREAAFETAVPERALTIGRREHGARPRVTLAVLGLPPSQHEPSPRDTAPEAYADGAAIGSDPGAGAHAENVADGDGTLGVEISDDRGWSVRGRIFDLVSRDDAREWARRNGR